MLEREVEMMRLYEIYKVKEQYQSFILGRERLLYHLLSDSNEAKPLKEITYLCEKLEEDMIQKLIELHLERSFSALEESNGQYKLTHPVKGSILISVLSHSLQASCDGSRMLDLDLFAALSKTDDRFFAVLDDAEEWGWLKPVKSIEQPTKIKLAY